MALSVATLADALVAIFAGRDGQPASAADAGERWAGAYVDYAAGAVAGPTTPLRASLDTAEVTLTGALASAFATAQAAGPGALTAALGAAWSAFWLTPPVAFESPPTGATFAGVVTVAAPGALPAGLSAAFAAGAAGASAAEQADAIAAALDAFTRAVFVVNTPVAPPGPSAPPVPLA